MATPESKKDALDFAKEPAMNQPDMETDLQDAAMI